jgi:hypothetical protein
MQALFGASVFSRLLIGFGMENPCPVKTRQNILGFRVWMVMLKNLWEF